MPTTDTLVTCVTCRTTVPMSTASYSDYEDGYFCSDCARDTLTCDNCDTLFHSNDAYYTYNDDVICP